jgi:hypothetical protein
MYQVVSFIPELRFIVATAQPAKKGRMLFEAGKLAPFFALTNL